MTVTSTTDQKERRREVEPEVTPTQAEVEEASDDNAPIVHTTSLISSTSIEATTTVTPTATTSTPAPATTSSTLASTTSSASLAIASPAADTSATDLEAAAEPTDDSKIDPSHSSRRKSETSDHTVTPEEHATDLSCISFPAPFYCPLTKKLMEDPVVAPDGISYERQAILETEKYTPEELYSNRGLNQIMEDVLSVAGDSIDASVRRFQKSMKQGIGQLLEMSVLPTGEFRPLPDAFYCPITFELMHVPVIDPEGNTFEHVAIANWIHVNSSSPITRNKLCMADLVPNRAIQDLLDLEKSKPDELMHPNVRKFKTEPAPVMPEFPEPSESGPNGGGPNHLGHPSLTFLFPTTIEELEYRRQARRKIVWCSVLGFICLVLAIVAAILYGGSCIFVSIWLSCCLKDSLRRLRELRSEEAAFAQLHEEEQRAQETQRREWQEQQEREARLEGGEQEEETANRQHELTTTMTASSLEAMEEGQASSESRPESSQAQ